MTRSTDDALWMRGLDEVAERFIQAIPADEAAYYRRMIFSAEPLIGGLPEPEEDTVYLTLELDRWRIGIPIRVAFLLDAPHDPEALRTLLSDVREQGTWNDPPPGGERSSD